MKSASQILSRPFIRPIEPKDFQFIRSLAAEFPTFTVPSEYVLWFFSHFHPDYCRVIEQQPGLLKAYLLAMPTTAPRNGIAIWQVAAAANPNQAFALEYFSAYLRELVERIDATSISFTASQDLATLRLIQSLARQFFDCEVAQLDSVPAEQGEFEFRLSIKQGGVSGKKPAKSS